MDMPGLGALADWGLVAVQLLLATICGGIIGYQRELHERPAGFRTHILVCVGAAVYMMVSRLVAGTEYDPGRIAAQVASGIGFLGAGTIIKQGSIVRGLTTAASLWAVAGIGLAIGYGWGTLVVAVLGTLTILLSLSLLWLLERRTVRHGMHLLTLTLADPRTHLDQVRGLLAVHDVEVHGLRINEEEAGRGILVLEVRAPSPDSLQHAMQALGALPGVSAVRWERQ